MPAYRLYFLDGADKVAAADWLEAADDAAAVEAARLEGGSRRWELWLRQRLVARLNSDGTVEPSEG